MPRKESVTGQISAQAQQDLLSDSIENFELPKSLVTKIARSAISESSKLQRDIVLSITKSSTVFINYLTATAHDVALSKQHKSISASDVLRALEIIEFGDLVDKLQAELQIYRETAKSDKSKKSGAGGSSKTKAKRADADTGATTGKSKAKSTHSAISASASASTTAIASISRPPSTAIPPEGGELAINTPAISLASANLDQNAEASPKGKAQVNHEDDVDDEMVTDDEDVHALEED